MGWSIAPNCRCSNNDASIMDFIKEWAGMPALKPKGVFPMKKILCAIMAVCLMLTLAACGNQKQQAPVLDMEALYESYQQHLPEMFYPDEDTLMNFLGISVEDCVQYKIAICAEGMRADEVWLIEAKDDAAMQNLTELANTRIQSKLDETETYAPDQYVIVQKAEVLTDGRYLALLISPEVEILKSGFEDALT